MARMQKAIFPLRRLRCFHKFPPGFSESLLPTQSHNNPSASNTASARTVRAPALMENNTLNSHAVRASKSCACALRCSVSLRSLVFLQSVCIFLLLCFDGAASRPRCLLSCQYISFCKEMALGAQSQISKCQVLYEMCENRDSCTSGS